MGVGEGNIRSRGQGRLLRGGGAEPIPGCWEEAPGRPGGLCLGQSPEGPRDQTLISIQMNHRHPVSATTPGPNPPTTPTTPTTPTRAVCLTNREKIFSKILWAGNLRGRAALQLLLQTAVISGIQNSHRVAPAARALSLE